MPLSPCGRGRGPSPRKRGWEGEGERLTTLAPLRSAPLTPLALPRESPSPARGAGLRAGRSGQVCSLFAIGFPIFFVEAPVGASEGIAERTPYSFSEEPFESDDPDKSNEDYGHRIYQSRICPLNCPTSLS